MSATRIVRFEEADDLDVVRRVVGAAFGGERVPELLDFYRCYRAYVRGKVLSFRLEQSGLDLVELQAV